MDGSVAAPERWRGRPMIVVFWATWCAFCARHNERIERLHRSLGAQGPQVLGVAVDGDAAAVARHVRGKGWTFPVTVDDGTLRPRFTPRRLVPMTALLDAQGRRGLVIPGEMSEEDVMALGRH